jgi:hypothetical protein
MESQLAPGYLFQVYQLEHAYEKKENIRFVQSNPIGKNDSVFCRLGRIASSACGQFING